MQILLHFIPISARAMAVFWDPSAPHVISAQPRTAAPTWLQAAVDVLSASGTVLVSGGGRIRSADAALLLGASLRSRVVVALARDSDARSASTSHASLCSATLHSRVLVCTSRELCMRLARDPTLAATGARYVVVEAGGVFGDIALSAALLAGRAGKFGVAAIGSDYGTKMVFVRAPKAAVTVRYSRKACADALAGAMEALVACMGRRVVVFTPGVGAARELAVAVDAWGRARAVRGRAAIRAVLILGSDFSGVGDAPAAYITGCAECGMIAGRVDTDVVVDCGLAETRIYDADAREWVVGLAAISRAEADKRAEFAGDEGLCLRLYTEEFYNCEMATYTAPDMLTCELSGALLMLKSLGVDDVSSFAYVYATPPAAALAAGLERLHELKALSGTGILTEVGKTLASLPFDAALGRAVLRAGRYGVHEEVLAIASILSEAPPGGSRALFHRMSARAPFSAEEGDHVTALNVYLAYIAAGKNGGDWCRKHHITAAPIRRAHALFRILKAQLRPAESEVSLIVGRDVAQRVCRALTDGLFAQAARLEPRDDGEAMIYSTIQRRRARIHPGSVLHGATPEWLVYGECVVTEERYLREVSVIRAEWLPEASAELYERQDE